MEPLISRSARDGCILGRDIFAEDGGRALCNQFRRSTLTGSLLIIVLALVSCSDFGSNGAPAAPSAVPLGLMGGGAAGSAGSGISARYLVSQGAPDQCEIRCIDPPDGCVYRGGLLVGPCSAVSCGHLTCGTGKAECPVIDCAAPPPGCHYEGAVSFPCNRQSCGTLVCDGGV